MNIKLTIIAAIITFLTLLTRCSKKQEQTSTLSTATLQALQKTINHYRIKYHIPGISVSIIMPDNNKVLTLTDGVKNIKNREKVTPHTLFQICSITKVYTAILAHQLVSDNKLKLSQTVGDWLPQYKTWKKVTIKQLLNMHSGIRSFTENKEFNNAWQKNPKKPWSSVEELKYVESQPLLYTPGSKWNYSDTNYILLGMIIEKASGHTYAQMLQQHIIKPLQLKQTFYIPREYTKAELNTMATGYSQDNKNVMNVNMSQAGPAGAIVATTSDTAIFFNSIFNSRLLKQKQLNAMLIPYSIKSGKQMNASSKMLEAWAVGIAQFWMPKVGLTWNKAGGFVGFFTQACYSINSHTTIVMAANKWAPKAFYNSTRIFIPKLYQIMSADKVQNTH